MLVLVSSAATASASARCRRFALLFGVAVQAAQLSVWR